MNYRKNTERLNIFIEEHRSEILIQERWKYNWLNDRYTTEWTYDQKSKFHNELDMLIWKNWGNHFKLKVKGSSDFAVKNQQKTYILNFDIKWVISDQHWIVNVTKIPPDGFMTSNVEWQKREINLDTEDTKLVLKDVFDKRSYYQYPGVHEFGHSIGNSRFSRKGMHGDEYRLDSGFKLDRSSIMNVGNELRKRHIDYIIAILNSMIPNTEFYIHSL